MMLETQRGTRRARLLDHDRHGHRDLPPRFSSTPVPPAITGPGAAWRVSPLTVCRRIAAIVRLWRQRARSRQQLSQLNEQMLKDIGLSRCDALREASKPFFRP